MRGLLYYFSGTGNTKYAADRFHDEFKFYGFNVDLMSIEKNESPSLENHDFLILGTPVYAGLPPKIVFNFVDKLPKADKMKCILYSTSAYGKASALKLLKSRIEEKNYDVVLETRIKMPNNFILKNVKKERTDIVLRDLKRAEKQVKDITAMFLKDEKKPARTLGLNCAFAKIENKIYRNILPNLSKNFSVSDECTKCGICLRNCPSSSITFENESVVFHTSCMMCMRCINICPVNAVMFKGKKTAQNQKDTLRLLGLK